MIIPLSLKFTAKAGVGGIWVVQEMVAYTYYCGN